MTCSSIPKERKGNAIRVLKFQSGTRRHVDDVGVSDAFVLEPFDPHSPAPDRVGTVNAKWSTPSPSDRTPRPLYGEQPVSRHGLHPENPR